MWTPRRILLLLIAIVGFAAVYVGYAQFLGRLDGLPRLPERYLEFDDQPLPELPSVISPTLLKLKEAFGENCAEMGAAYPTRLEMREQGVVFAAGMPQIGSEPTRFVRLAPISVALFGKARPEHERQPDETVEISTLHSDEGILEFDQPIASDRDMLSGKARLIAIELRSNPDPNNPDPRNSRILLTNNQRCRDPARMLLLKTPGPVFYRTADHPQAHDPSVPQIVTHAPVEIVNRANLPRPLHGPTLPAVPAQADDLSADTVAEMALGLRTSPPTVTAEGLEIYLNRQQPGAAAGKAGGFSGVREIVLRENVLFSLWIDSAAGFPGKESAKDHPVYLDPPANHPGANRLTAALLGGLSDGYQAAQRLKNKALLRIRTLGSFRYDIAANLARFDIAPAAPPIVPNNVEVTRHLPMGAQDYLVCQRLELEFNGPVAGQGDEARTATPSFKRLLATGAQVLIAAATEQLQAQGNALYYETNPAEGRTTTVLRGAPLSAARGKNLLTAGSDSLVAELAFTSITDDRGGKQTQVAIQGPGRVDLFDESANDKMIAATWATSLVQTREALDDLPLDRLVFTGAAEFIDPKQQFRLRADVLNLWLKASSTEGQPPVPHRLQGLGNVKGLAAEAEIDDTDQLTVMFLAPAKSNPADLPPALVANSSPTGSVPTGSMPSGSTPAANTLAGSTPAGVASTIQPFSRPRQPDENPRPPVKLSARKIDVWLFAAAQPGAPQRYDLHEARCDDRVLVKQDPVDPAKSPVGLEISGGSLLLKKRDSGHVMTVAGTADNIARVRFEHVTIAGPNVHIDQPGNSVAVSGAGWMRMPSSGDLADGGGDRKTEITIHWQNRMKFHGGRRWAEFVGLVQAVQTPQPDAAPAQLQLTKTTVACHELNVTFDRPVYFNQLNKPRTEAGEGRPKVEAVVCTPVSEDGDGGEGSRTVLYLEETTEKSSGRVLKAQQIEGKLLEVRVLADRNLVTASGPGTTRILQPGPKETRPGQPATGAEAETEMKLTIVQFQSRLEMIDQKGIFRKALFRGGVRVAQAPTEDLNLQLDETAPPPPRSLFLKCEESFAVTSHRSRTPGREDDKTMEAVGAAEVKTDDYIGMGHSINFDGEKVTLRGYQNGMATLYRRQRTVEGQDYKSGNLLVYNTRTGQVSGAQSSGGSFTVPKK